MKNKVFPFFWQATLAFGLSQMMAASTNDSTMPLKELLQHLTQI